MQNQVSVKNQNLKIISYGLALFSMFFGAGNIIFPLIIGMKSLSAIPYSFLGLFITAIIIPFSGVIAITLFHGDYKAFFGRTGRFVGPVVILILFGLIGPFGGLPRLVSLTYSCSKVYFPNIYLSLFSVVYCALVFFLCIKKRHIVKILGLVLTPLLLVSIFFMILKGVVFSSGTLAKSAFTPSSGFLYGLKEGFNTMDLLASFFFASFLYHRLEADGVSKLHPKALARFMLIASLIGALLLSLVYIGFCYLSGLHFDALKSVPMDELLGTIGMTILGPNAGLLVSIIVMLTCLTTAIALATLSAEFVQAKIKKINYLQSLIVVLLVTFAVSTLEFNGIVKVLFPILEVIYPSLLMLNLMNIANKLFEVKIVKTPVFLIFAFMLVSVFV